MNLSENVLDLSFYQNAYSDLGNFSNELLQSHWENFGSREGRIPNLLTLDALWRDRFNLINFDWKAYLFLNPDLPFTNEIQARIHYLNVGSKENRSFFLNDYQISTDLQIVIKQLNLGNLINDESGLVLSNLLDLQNFLKTSTQNGQSIESADMQMSVIDFYENYDLSIPSPSDLNRIDQLILRDSEKTPGFITLDILIRSILHIELLNDYKKYSKFEKNSDLSAIHLIGELVPRDRQKTLEKFFNLSLQRRSFNLIVDNFTSSIFRSFNRFFSQFAKKPKVTLIASMYAGDNFIKNFLLNLTAMQKFWLCELLIIDANSPDDELKEIKRYQKSFKNIKYVKVDSRISLYQAWNLAINESESEYITNVNLDDLRLRKYLRRTLRVLKKNKDIDVVFANFYYAYLENFPIVHTKKIGLKSNLGLLTKHGLLDFNSPHSAPIWRRKLHKEIGFFDEKFQSAADWEFWLRCAEKGKTFGQIKDSLSIYYVNPDGISTSASTKDFAEQKAIRKIYKHLLTQPDSVISKWI